MDALVQAALNKVNEQVKLASPEKRWDTNNTRKVYITRAINAVDALKSALKTL